MSDIEDLEPLSPGERLFFKRRREGKTQTEAGAEVGVKTRAYAIRELGLSGAGRDEADQGPTLRELTDNERCVLYRRRAKVPQRVVAEGLGCSIHWVSLMELGKRPCDRLLWYWEQ